MTTAGERFARALAVKDGPALRAVLADGIDFKALTPGRFWESASPGEIADEFVLGMWFGAGSDIIELRSVETGEVSDRERVAYRVLVRRADGDYLVEQQAYYDTDGERITWMRVLCSGYQKAPGH